MGIAGESVGLNHWVSDCYGEEEGIYNNQHSYLGQVHTCSAQEVTLTTIFVYLLNQIRAAI